MTRKQLHLYHCTALEFRYFLSSLSHQQVGFLPPCVALRDFFLFFSILLNDTMNNSMLSHSLQASFVVVFIPVATSHNSLQTWISTFRLHHRVRLKHHVVNTLRQSLWHQTRTITTGNSPNGSTYSPSEYLRRLILVLRSIFHRNAMSTAICARKLLCLAQRQKRAISLFNTTTKRTNASHSAPTMNCVQLLRWTKEVTPWRSSSPPTRPGHNQNSNSRNSSRAQQRAKNATTALHAMAAEVR